MFLSDGGAPNVTGQTFPFRLYTPLLTGLTSASAADNCLGLLTKIIHTSDTTTFRAFLLACHIRN